MSSLQSQYTAIYEGLEKCFQQDKSLPNNLAELRERQEKSLAPVKAEILKDFEKFRFENVWHFLCYKFFFSNMIGQSMGQNVAARWVPSRRGETRAESNSPSPKPSCSDLFRPKFAFVRIIVLF